MKKPINVMIVGMTFGVDGTKAACFTHPKRSGAEVVVVEDKKQEQNPFESRREYKIESMDLTMPYYSGPKRIDKRALRAQQRKK